jgi:hypothetical protein
MICVCSTSKKDRQMGSVACGVRCLNRIVKIECGKSCPCDLFCTNKNFQKKNNADIKTFKTDQKGWGVKANVKINANVFIIEYVGEVIDEDEFKKRMKIYIKEKSECFYTMELTKGIFVDSTKRGNISRFFNHSCDPNCEAIKWEVDNKLRIGLFSKRTIAANEELTFDYKLENVGKVPQECFCGSEKCNGKLGKSNYKFKCGFDLEDNSSNEKIIQTGQERSFNIDLFPETICILVNSIMDVFSPQLRKFCFLEPISVIRCLSCVLNLNLSLFSSLNLLNVCPLQKVELRNQVQQLSDENWDLHGNKHVWFVDEKPSFTELFRYAEYQAKLLEDEKKTKNASNVKANNQEKTSSASLKKIKFCMNLCLSDKKMWANQLKELEKLPPFMHAISDLKAPNIQLKVPGCRTPGHKPEDTFYSIDLNIGPGDCEWFSVDGLYMPDIEALCNRNNVNIMDSWWPNLIELQEERIPVNRFFQKAGDIVCLNKNCVHWVQSVGWCNNVKWNINLG